MARVNDLLNSLGAGPDGVGVLYPDTFQDDLLGAYTADMEAPAAKIAVLEADLAAANEKILLLQAHNYELLTTSAVEPEPEGEPNAAEDNPESEENDENSGVASLFKKKEGE